MLLSLFSLLMFIFSEAMQGSWIYNVCFFLLGVSVLLRPNECFWNLHEITRLYIYHNLIQIHPEAQKQHNFLCRPVVTYRHKNNSMSLWGSILSLCTLTCEKMRKICFNFWTPYLTTASKFSKSISGFFGTLLCLPCM